MSLLLESKRREEERGLSPPPELLQMMDDGGSKAGHHARQLTEEEILKLSQDITVVPGFKQNKLEHEAQKNWDLFYKRNSTNFFKDRHWSLREFSELCGFDPVNDAHSNKVLLEVGCGVGNFIFPLIEENPGLFIYACDFSPRAVEFVKANPLYNQSKCSAFVCDITNDKLQSELPENSIDIASMVFVLSSIHPQKMKLALDNIYRVLKPGGVLLFRDYGLFDQAMLRFSKGHKLEENFYVRQDGTRAYYFSEEFLSATVVGSGFKVENNHYVQRQTINKKEGINVPRIFIQGRFSKPVTS